MESSSADLVIAMQQGSGEAFRELYQQYWPTVFGVAMRRCRNRTKAEEVTQHVFMIVHHKRSQLREPEHFPGWLKRIAVRTSINYMTRGPQEDPMEFMGEFYEADSETPDIDVLRREQAVHVRIVLENDVRALDRDTIQAFYFDGLSLKEMSEKFSAPVGTIKRRLHTARQRFAESLLRAGVVEPGEEF